MERLTRLGARATGLDFSPLAIEAARNAATVTELNPLLREVDFTAEQRNTERFAANFAVQASTPEVARAALASAHTQVVRRPAAPGERLSVELHLDVPGRHRREVLELGRRRRWVGDEGLVHLPVSFKRFLKPGACT